MTSHSKPKTPREILYVFFTGLCMGAADVVPGVSGGTMAFIMGVYEDLLNGIKSFNIALIRKLLKFDIKGCIEHVPLVFLAALGGGILVAILTLAERLTFALEHHESLLFAFFFGLILASVVVLAKQIKWNAIRGGGLVSGAVIGFLIVTLTPHDMPHTWFTLLWCGSIAIMAMILPGISGSFLLLILGQYEYILTCVKDRDFLALIPVGAGAAIGLLAFSRVLSWLLARWHDLTVAVLIGFMIGSLRKIWPWKEVTNSFVKDDGEVKVLADRILMPEINGEFGMAIGLAVLGFVVILLIEGIQSRRQA